MITSTNLLSFALLTICLLFAVAWYSDRKKSKLSNSPTRSGIIYALTLGVYCTSWTFYGAVGSATESPWSHAPIYLGPILLFLFAWPLVKHLLAVGARHRVTSVADYISARFGKRHTLGVLVTLVATAAVLPYIALQFKALAQAWVAVDNNQSLNAVGGDTALITAIMLAAFTILFGTRRMDSRERHRGLMSAIALESIIKLVAFIIIALLAVNYLTDIPNSTAATQSHALDQFTLTPDFIARTLISALAILCLPRQFHVMVVEGQGNVNTRYARWLFPLYLLLFMLLAIPISLAGAHIFTNDSSVNPDIYVQLLPLALDTNWITLVAFIGGFSAATGMVIVATVSLAIMITNEVVTPIVMRLNDGNPSAILKLGDNLRRIRQVVIVAILFAAWLVTRQIMDIPWLTQIGFICFLAAAQLAPAIIAGLYWQRAHGMAVISGLLVGTFLWFYCAVLPAVLPAKHELLTAGLFNVSWLSPSSLFGTSNSNPLSYATAWSLGLNLFTMVALSWLVKPSAADERQARLFINDDTSVLSGEFDLSSIRISQLQGLLPPFVDGTEQRKMWQQFEKQYQQRLLAGDRAPRFVVYQVESVIASVIGATSAHKIIEQLERSRQLAFSDFANMVSDASKQHTFNRELLETTVENLIQGVAVIDEELRLVAWNSRYQEIFDYPERFLYVGCPIERIYRFNAERGILGAGEKSVDEAVNYRLEKMRSGSPHQIERTLPDGKVIQINGKPMSSGGYVTTYIDITDYREMVKELEEARIELEQKVASGSQTLSETNAELRQENRLRAQVEASLRDAHKSKSRFMSATSHDLLQPINAARLFTTALKPRLQQSADTDALQLAGQIDTALKRAEQMIAELREIAKLDSGTESANMSHFNLGDVFNELQQEFSPVTKNRGLTLHVIANSQWLYSDKALVQRILQNLIANALNYTQTGRVTVGLRRRATGGEIQVLDTGPGIAEQDQVRIFQEFERGTRAGTEHEDGLGLGLAIINRYASMLELPLHLASTVGKGTLFSITVPFGIAQSQQATTAENEGDLAGLHILCLDNEPLILQGMEQLLLSMGATVSTAQNREQLHAEFSDQQPDILLVDYQLDNNDSGISAAVDLLKQHTASTPCVVISANNSDECRDSTRNAGFRYLSKPVNEQRLRALILALVNVNK